MGRHTEALAEHPGEMVFGQRTHGGQLAEADGVFPMLVDVLHQPPPLVRGQTAFKRKPSRAPTWLSKVWLSSSWARLLVSSRSPGSCQLRLTNW